MGRLVYFAGLILALSPVHGLCADPVVLAREPGKLVAEYDSRVASVRAGDTIELSRGKRFTVREVKPPGGFCRVFIADASDGTRVALRLPLQADLGLYLQAWDNGHAVYEAAGVPMVRMDRNRSVPGEYIVAEPLAIQHTLEEVLSAESSVPMETRRRLLGEPLEAFFRALWQFESVGDARPANIGWVNGRWVLFDMDDQFTLASRDSTWLPVDLHVYDRYGEDLVNHPQIDLDELKSRMRRALDQERAARFGSGLSNDSPLVRAARLRRTLRVAEIASHPEVAPGTSREANRSAWHRDVREQLARYRRECGYALSRVRRAGAPLPRPGP